MFRIPEFLFTAPRYLFFTGKGGVGKTSLACASAVLLADQSKRVLLVSTDPASNLDAVLGSHLANSPTSVAGIANLRAMNIDPELAAREYRERTIGPYRNVLPPQEFQMVEETLSGACTVEIAAFDEFASLLSEQNRTQAFDHVIFDTAPTGHTLRLLELPAAWTGFLESTPGDVSCLGPLSGLRTQRERYSHTVDALADPKMTAIVLVARPERVALIEAARTSEELRSQAMTNQLLVLNGVFRAADRDDLLAVAFERRGADALSQIPEELASLPRAEVPLLPSNIVGLPILRSFLTAQQPIEATPSGPAALPPAIDCLADLVDQLSQSDHGAIMVMGKGGVGKTTVAAAIAVTLARRGLPVHLTTTDPAQHIWETLQSDVAGLRVSYIDPKHEARQYRERMLDSARTTLSSEQLALFQEELKSPCHDEVAVFQAFARIIMGARRELVVVDTAPTGHTLLLLDTTGSYHRQMMQERIARPEHIRTPLMLLRDPEYTKVLIVTLPETTPVLEASALQDDLRRAQIEPFAWIVNASLAAAQPRDPVLRARALAEIPHMRTVKDRLATRVVLIPFQAEEPVGAQRLNSLAVGVAGHSSYFDLAAS